MIVYRLLLDQHIASTVRAMYMLPTGDFPELLRLRVFKHALILHGLDWTECLHVKIMYDIFRRIREFGINTKQPRSKQLEAEEARKYALTVPEAVALAEKAQAYFKDLAALDCLVIPLRLTPVFKPGEAQTASNCQQVLPIELLDFEELPKSSEEPEKEDLIKIKSSSYFSKVLTKAATSLEVLYNGSIYTPCTLCKRILPHMAGKCYLQSNEWCALELLFDSLAEEVSASDMDL